ncbi:flavoprotein [Frankia sp. Cr1]|uniref:flavoprotein n=1 Tax=Frankia sp. Cr1 TaxID=3073931 RepID=UPI002AD59D05|nr:flavoprotein [Frankia sp. Cr1]
MTASPARRTDVLYHIVCAGPPAADAATFVDLARIRGWDVCLLATPNAVPFLDLVNLAGITGHPVRSTYKKPADPDVLPPANALVVAPATFNTVNKIAAGIADTLAVSLVCEYLGMDVPIVVAPNVNPALARHPAYRRSLDQLADWGVTVVVDPSASPPT